MEAAQSGTGRCCSVLRTPRRMGLMGAGHDHMTQVSTPREVGMASGGGGKLILSTFALLTTRSDLIVCYLWIRSDLIVCYLWIHRTRAHCADGGAKVLGVDHSLSARSLPRRNPG